MWPSRILFSITVPHALPILSQLQGYMTTRSPPIPVTTFLPERIRDPDRNVINQTHFRSLSRMLWDSQLVAIVPISLPDSAASPPFSHGSRHGMLVYPVGNSTSLLVGAIFLSPQDTFPDFVLAGLESFPDSMFDLPLQTLVSRFGAPSDEERSTIPISPTVIHSQSRPSQQRRMSLQPHSSLREPSVRISSYRYDPTQRERSSSFSQTRPSFIAPSSDAPRRMSPFRYQPSSFPTPNFSHYDPTTMLTLEPAPSMAASSSTQSDSPLEHHSRFSSIHDRDASGDSSHSRSIE
ncbi:hypothetical protein GYMLUDRAFT_36628 [Collybiopsis luxurians FD-317 M1]|nr:hypothetical protein GYMLUDRAFT_36628 [Collybiopsis luxurians FD-317 M1]